MNRPLVCTFVELMNATESLHLGEKRAIADLHDVWLKGAPTPESRIVIPRYDPRKVQRGAIERRIVFPALLARWIMDVSARRGFPYSFEQAIELAKGQYHDDNAKHG